MADVKMISLISLISAFCLGCPNENASVTTTAASKTTKPPISGSQVTIPNCTSADQIGCKTTARFTSKDSEETPQPGETIVEKDIKDFLPSLSHHDRFSDAVGKQVTLSTEHAYGVGAKPSGYRDIPQYALDSFGDAGYGEVNNVKRNSSTEWDTGISRKICGKTAITIKTKIADCDLRHAGARPIWDQIATDGALTWDGARQGNGSEGSWTLVTISHPTAFDGDICDSSCTEVWRDDRTGYLWSDQIKNGATTIFNWCHASGANKNNKSGNPYAEVDPLSYCDNATYQVQSYSQGDSSTLPVSLCAEDSLFLNTPSWTDLAKGNMRLNSATAPVRWRLPTKQAMSLGYIVNGGYYVLPGNGPEYWSASLRTGNTGVAWYFNSTYGFIYGQFGGPNRSQQRAIRCVGRP